MPSNERTLSIPYLYQFLKRAIAGEPTDYTSGSIRQAIILLAVPMILEMMMESIFAVVDLYFVGHLRDSTHAIQTVGLTESVISILYAIAIGISMAATAVVARRIGEKNPDEAAKSAVQAIILSFIITVIISTTGVIYAPDILRIMGADAATIATGAVYTRILMGGSIVITLLFLINGIFRGSGDASMAMKSLWVANCCNILLCPLLIFGLGPIPALGLKGAALATTVGRGIGVLYQLYHLWRGKGVVKIRLKHLVFDWPQITSIIKIASPGTLQFIIGSCSWIFLARLVAETGHSAASAGYQTAIRIVMFFLLPAWGMSNAAATLVGQNLGAGQPDRAEISVRKTALYNVIFTALVSALFLFASPFMVGIFTNVPEVAAYAVRALRIISAGYIFFGVGMVMMNAFNGAGDTWTPTWINFGVFWFFQIPFAYVLAKSLNFGPEGVFIAIPVAEMLLAIAAWILFKRGAWKLKKV